MGGGSLAPRARMGRIISLGQVLKIKPGVNLGRADLGMPQQLLNGTQIPAGLQHMAGKRMTQHVRMNRHIEPGLQGPPTQATPNRSGTQPTAAPTDEQRLR